LNPASTVKVGGMTPTDSPHRPNHHAHHRGFTGLPGTLAALSMAFGRTGDARLAVELTGLRPGEHLVDLGCGPGAASRYAARRGARVTGVDPAPVMLDMARRLTRRAPGVTFVEGTADAIPVADASVDAAWALATVHHWPDLEPSLREVARVLEPGGRFLAAERLTSEGATGLASHGWTPEQAEVFATLCCDAGFDDLRIATHAGRRTLISVLARRP
jgi:ubiquinone/menaquinone biosynthesis C-methylase UbiE